jgi:predicted phosphodiesterase
MKIALFSDIHGTLTGVRAVLAALDAEGGADPVIAAGDFVAGGPATDAVIDLLRDRGVLMVRGDSDTGVRLQDRLRTAAHAESSSRYPPL